jgi:hypothetical protein
VARVSLRFLPVFGFFWLKFLFCSLFHGTGSESTAMTAGDAFFSRVIDGGDKY